ncbi:MAG: DNA methyltransferase, partial [Pyrinomonadaceae bacterium]
MERYQSARRPVAVNFAGLSSQHYVKDRLTHRIHFYPAKLLGQIPAFFVRALTSPGDVVLDPFAGSGTVALEAILAGRKALVAEINPLARLISRVKTTPLSFALLQREISAFCNAIDLRGHSISALPSILSDWHDEGVLRQLSAILNCLRRHYPETDDPETTALREFMLLVFSAMIRRKSLADPRIAPPVRLRSAKFRKGSRRRRQVNALLRAKRKLDCRAVFRQVAIENARRVGSLATHLQAPSTMSVVAHDARDIPLTKQVVADLIVTSPPYLAAQKYTRSTSLELYWLGFLSSGAERSRLEHKVIGSEIAQLKRGQHRPRNEFKAIDRLIQS